MTTREYEAMFLLDNNAATADYAAVSSAVDEILRKHGADLVLQEKWDERKLAYDIRGHRRGTYYLVYFRAPTEAIARVNEDMRLMETVLRHLILVLDEPIETHVQKRAEEREKLAEDNRRHALGGWGDSRRKRDRRSRREDGESDGDEGDEVFDVDNDDADGPGFDGEAGAEDEERSARPARPGRR